MSWGLALALWLVPVAAMLGGFTALWRWRIRRLQVAAGAPLRVGVRRERLRLVLLWLGLLLTVVAVAGPRWGTVTETRTANGADVLLLIDCSRSMLADDLYPSRIEAARRKALDLMQKAPGTRLALMPFAAVPALRCPLTGDHQVISSMLQDCSPELFPAESGYQGTAIGRSVREGLTVLGRQVERGQAILIVSDGADPDSASVQQAADQAKAAGVPILALFIGDPEKNAMITIDGAKQTMVADRSTLEKLAAQTNGLCVNAVPDDRDVVALAEHLQRSAAARPWEERRRLVASERYQWVLLPALACLALGTLLPTRRRMR